MINPFASGTELITLAIILFAIDAELDYRRTRSLDDSVVVTSHCYPLFT